MCSFEDDDDREDSRDFETQQIDSQYPDRDSEDDETNDFRFLTNTMPVDDSYLLDDAFETQFMNLAGETQVVDLDDETQVLDELDCMKNMPIELLNEPCTENVDVSICQDANKTEAFCETQVLPQEDDYVKVDDMGSVGPENTEENCPPTQDTFRGGFTAIRSASMRASGLAARERGSSRNSCPISSEKSSVEQETSNKDDECLQNECIEDIEDPENLNKCKIAPTAVVRELYHDDEIDQFEITDLDDNNPDIASGNCLAGLSYADSQEPGALSQAHALEVVDKFLDLNVMDYEERFGREVKNVEKTKADVPVVKGSRELAKKSCGLKKAEGKIGAYDWDDNREDDGGGEFFLKKKEQFFNQPNPKGLTEPRVKAVARNTGDNTEQKWSKNNLKGSAFSDLGRMSCKMRANVKCGEKEKLLQKNLIKEFERHVNVGRVPNLVENEITTNFTDTKDDTVGPDTQMAAEAMETLCFEIQLGDNNNDDAPDKAEATGKNQSAKERNHDTCVGVVTRQSKQQQKRINESLLSSRNLGLRVSENRGTKSTGQRREKKCHLEDHLDFYVPVAHRTRKGTGLRLSKELAKPFDNRVTRKSATTIDKTVGSSGPTVSNADTINNRKEKRPRQENLVQADPQYSNGMLKRSRKVGANSLGTQPEKNLWRQNASECGKGDTKKAKADGGLEASSPPATFRTALLNNASPICKGDEYHKQSCRKNLSRLSLIMEIDNVVTESPGPFGGTKGSRKRKDITSVRVLFSQHLDEDVVKQQKKILAKLGGAVATFMSDATHFVADEFVRTRNMLEAIAFGKPVVSHLWLVGCGQACCLIDEKNYILRDSKKEKEFGFCLLASLSRACQHPLLQGQKVLVTPNTKPGKVILANLVKAVHGLAIERVGRSVLKDEKLPDDLLILSCEDDYELCVPFLEKGGAIYSSELLLNGIVKQKLEYERHRLFEDHVKKTRSTTWMKTKSTYHPVTKRK